MIEDFNPEMDSIQLNFGDSISVHSIRDTALTIKVSKSESYSPERDALILATILTTSLDPITLAKLTRLLNTDPYLEDKGEEKKTGFKQKPN